ncbi:ATP-binding protein [Streptomyces sp. NPDC091268]|uniref:ATP-binding protein n=1 Tax=Streptomyces sp. NPDC091268 TaxID=3365979 RepID=UPI0038293BB6
MPLRSTLHLALDGQGAAADARHAARSFLAPSSPAHPEVPPLVVDTALLVISELVTNAVRHTDGACVLDLSLEPDGIEIDVTDTSSVEPRARPPGHQGEGGWGWHLVNRLGTDVRIDHHGPGHGKTVHVRVPR